MPQNFIVHDKYIIYNDVADREKFSDFKSEAAAINRLFAICEGGTYFTPDALERLLEQYPNAAWALTRCASTFYPWGERPWGRAAQTLEKYPLHVACRNNAPISVIRTLIQAWPEALQSRADNRLPLHEACACAKSLSTIELLVELWPASIQQRTGGDGFLPLELALEQSEASLDIIQFLVKQWPESVQKESQARKRDALRIALYFKLSNDIIQYLVQEWPESVMKCENGGATPLHYACGYGQSLSTVQFLAERWPDAVRINGKIWDLSDTDRGGLPLMWALLNENTSFEIVNFLLDLWPESVKEKSLDGETALGKAMILKKDVKIISLLIDRCPDVLQIPNRFGNLPIQWALIRQERPSPELMHLLTNGMPPLHFICKYSPRPWIPSLTNGICYVVTPNDVMQSYDGELPFHWICRSRPPQAALEWWCRRYPTLVSTRTNHTHELPLHCYLSSTSRTTTTTATTRGTDDTDEIIKTSIIDRALRHNCNDDAYYLSAVQYLVQQHPDALTRTDRMGRFPVHVAALHDAPLDVVFYLACQNPEALQTTTGGWLPYLPLSELSLLE